MKSLRLQSTFSRQSFLNLLFGRLRGGVRPTPMCLEISLIVAETPRLARSLPPTRGLLRFRILLELSKVLPCSPCEPRSLLCVASFSRGFIAGALLPRLGLGVGWMGGGGRIGSWVSGRRKGPTDQNPERMPGGEKGTVTFYERSDDAKDPVGSCLRVGWRFFQAAEAEVGESFVT